MSLKRFLIKCSHLYPEMRRYELVDRVLTAAVKAYPNNTNLVGVLTKVVLLNSLYGTQIYDTIKIAEHIKEARIDAGIRQGNLLTAYRIQHGHGIKTKKGNERNLYSFATKYLCWHNPKGFPIYDNLIKKLLPWLNRDWGFYNRGLSQSTLSDYPTLKAVIDSLTSFAGLEHFRYKRIDQALWVYAKFKYKRDELLVALAAEIEAAKQEM